MKKLLLVAVTLIVCHVTSVASGDNLTAGARATAMGDASVTFSDVFSTTTNQAGLGFIKQYSAGFYTDRKFLNASINNFNAAIAVPVNKVGAFGLSANYFGFSLYNETKIGLAYARAFGEKFSMGVQFDFLRVAIAENGSRNFYTFELGFLYKPWKTLTIGAHVYNPIPYKVEKNFGERLPTVMKFGLGYQPARQVLITAEYEQDIFYKPQFKAGVEYLPIKYLAIRGGVQTTPFSASFGLGGNVAGAQLDVSASFHPMLGFTPQVSFIYSFRTNRKNK